MAVEMLHIDCRDYMRSLPDKAFDLAIVDPPYGINAPKMNMGVNGNRVRDGRSRGQIIEQKKISGRLNNGSGKLKNRVLNTMNCQWDIAAPDAGYFDELFRVSKNQIIWGGNYFNLPPTRCIICWDKVQPWENFSQWEMAWTSFDKPAAMFRHSNTGGNPHKNNKIHPTQKPVHLYKWLLSKFSSPGYRILDTHGGSGSSAIAAHDMGFDMVWMEIDSDYYASACKRFRDHIAQMKMF